MIKNLLLVLSLAGFCFGSVACFILLFINKTQKHANRLMALLLITLVNILLASFLFEWNPELYAHIFRLPSSLLFILFPTAYLYTRALKNNDRQFTRKDVLHFVPAILYMVEMMPFYLSSYSSKLSAIQEIKIHPNRLIALNEGILPPNIHIGFLCLQAIAYLVLVTIMIKKTNGTENSVKPVKIYNYKWLQAFVLVTGLIAFPLVFFFVNNNFFIGNNFQFLLITVVTCFLFVTLYLFFQPETLYGIRRTEVALIDLGVTNSHTIVNENDGDLTQFISCPDTNRLKGEEEIQNSLFYLNSYKPALECYIISTKPFLRQGYTIQDLSRETEIPQHHLSALLNRVYGVRFNDFVNDLRIRFISENLSNLEWQKLTIEGIAKQAGFTSRTTFFNAIKKTTGRTPSEFIEHLKKQTSESCISE